MTGRSWHVQIPGGEPGGTIGGPARVVSRSAGADQPKPSDPALPTGPVSTSTDRYMWAVLVGLVLILAALIAPDLRSLVAIAETGARDPVHVVDKDFVPPFSVYTCLAGHPDTGGLSPCAYITSEERHPATWRVRVNTSHGDEWRDIDRETWLAIEVPSDG